MVINKTNRVAHIAGLLTTLLILPISLFLCYWSYTYRNEGGWDTVNDSPEYLKALSMHKKELIYSSMYLLLNLIAIVSSIITLLKKSEVKKLVLWLSITTTITTIIIFIFFTIKTFAKH